MLQAFQNEETQPEEVEDIIFLLVLSQIECKI